MSRPDGSSRPAAPVPGGPPETCFRPAALALRVRALADRAPGRVILGIVGPPGAGKSSIAAALATELGPAAVAVPMDGFHYSNAVLRALGRAGRKGAPDTFDVDGYLTLLERLRRDDGRTVYAPGFDRQLDEPVAGDLAVPASARIVITEGNYLLLPDPGWSRVRPLLDEAWYVEVDQSLRLERLIARHRHFGKDDAAARAWAAGPDEANARVIAAARSAADLVIRY
jgi:pantothenate kinase